MWDFLQENGEKLLMLAVEAVGIFVVWKRTSKTTPEQKRQARAQKAEARAEKLLTKAKAQAKKADELREVKNANSNEKQNA